ncbi:MAG: hypothetical protein CVV53_04115, partial [Spirochaetae bacterium HGW-Spirochaetae-9]
MSKNANNNYPEALASGEVALGNASSALSSGDTETALAQARSAFATLSSIKEYAEFPAAYIIDLLPERKNIDSFTSIAAAEYGYNDHRKWPVLYEANRSILKDPSNPNLLLSGQTVVIPSIKNELRSGIWDPKKTYPVFEKGPDSDSEVLGAIDQPLLDEQRGVVQNEKRQGENQPYGRRVFTELFRTMYPEGHPYSWPTIGSMADLDAASLEDVKTWFRTWYGPNNAVLVLAGDIDLATAKTKVTRYFGDIPASASVAKMPAQIPLRKERTRATLPDRVPQPRIYRAWNVTQTGTDDATRLELIANILGGGKSSRLSRRLVHEEKLADNVSAFAFTQEIAGNFVLIADIKPDADLAKVEKILDEEVARLLADGPSADEVETARTVIKAGFLRGIER